jgi:hypothetical protein
LLHTATFAYCKLLVACSDSLKKPGYAQGVAVLLLLLLQAAGYCDAETNDGIISRPRLLVRDPTLFSLLRFIYTPSVVQINFRSICLNCNKTFLPDAEVMLLEQRKPVSSMHNNVHCTSMR